MRNTDFQIFWMSGSAIFRVRKLKLDDFRVFLKQKSNADISKKVQYFLKRFFVYCRCIEGLNFLLVKIFAKLWFGATRGQNRWKIPSLRQFLQPQTHQTRVGKTKLSKLGSSSHLLSKKVWHLLSKVGQTRDIPVLVEPFAKISNRFFPSKTHKLN